MTGLLGRRCRHGSVLSVPSLMVVRLGYSITASSSGVMPAALEPRRLSCPPGKIEVTTTQVHIACGCSGRHAAFRDRVVVGGRRMRFQARLAALCGRRAVLLP